MTEVMNQLKHEHIIDETVTIEDADIEDVYEKCRLFFTRPWDIFSTIRHNDRPFNLQLDYTHWLIADTPLTMITEMNFTQLKNGVEMRLRMRGLNERPWQGSRPFIRVAERLFRRLGVEEGDNVYRSLWSVSDLRSEIRMWDIQAILFGFVFVFAIVVFPYMTGIPVFSDYRFLVVGVGLGGAMFIRNEYEAWKTRKLLRRLYPDHWNE